MTAAEIRLKLASLVPRGRELLLARLSIRVARADLAASGATVCGNALYSPVLDKAFATSRKTAVLRDVREDDAARLYDRLLALGVRRRIEAEILHSDPASKNIYARTRVNVAGDDIPAE